jgi:NitT/TauT family transport system permease protein
LPRKQSGLFMLTSLQTDGKERREMQNGATNSTERKTQPVKKKRFAGMDNFSRGLMVMLSFAIMLLLWSLIAAIPGVGAVIVGPVKVFKVLMLDLANGKLLVNIQVSLFRVLGGFGLGLVAAIPVAFLLGWYKPFQLIVEPWIQFFRTIPPIALIPLVIVIFGIGTSAKIAIIFFAVFLVMVVTIYQGVKNVDATLIKAARVLDATSKDIFLDVIVPASFPYILVGIRLGLATALTTLVAAELTGASQGLGNMIQEAALYFNMDEVMLGIITIGVIGFIADKAVLFLEKKLTGWQEVNNR